MVKRITETIIFSAFFYIVLFEVWFVFSQPAHFSGWLSLFWRNNLPWSFNVEFYLFLLLIPSLVFSISILARSLKQFIATVPFLLALLVVELVFVNFMDSTPQAYSGLIFLLFGTFFLFLIPLAGGIGFLLNVAERRFKKYKREYFAVVPFILGLILVLIYSSK